MQKPKILYRYDPYQRIEKHKLGVDCAPQIVKRELNGTLWRCRCRNDYYGYGTLKEAKQEEIGNTVKEIGKLTAWLAKLRKDINP